MTDRPIIRDVRFGASSPADRAKGLLGWVRCLVGEALVVDGIAVRRTRSGRLTLSYPRGRGKCPPVRPLDDEARRAIERQILEAIDLDGEGVR